MLKSMTGFGRSRKMNAAGDKDITVEIRSVNSRYLDLTVKMPRSVSYLEDRVRTYLSSRGIVRGKVELYVGIDVLSETGTDVILDRGAAESYIAALRTLRDEFGLADDISVMTVAQNRELFRTRRPEDNGDRDFADILPALSEAVDIFCAAREREGASLESDLRGKVDNIKECARKVAALSDADTKECRDKLYARISKILEDTGVEIAESRILTEAAVYADRIAIDEELVRLDSHFAAMDEIFASDAPAGRRLDFLMQEMNRETNTIGSKASNSEIAHLVVEMKNELEKIREQIQNIE